jgi:hypothetical protein
VSESWAQAKQEKPIAKPQVDRKTVEKRCGMVMVYRSGEGKVENSIGLQFQSDLSSGV